MVIEKCAMTDAGTYTAVGVNEVGKLTYRAPVSIGAVGASAPMLRY